MMNYRKIDFDGRGSDEKLETLLMQIAKWHNMTPKLWIPDYKPSMEDIEETKEKILNTKDEDLFIAIAEDNQGNIQGFIWAYKQEDIKDTVMISSLYVTGNYRKYGVATNLKALLEEWCSLEKIKVIQTTVHYKNTSMLTLNQKLGYIPGMVNMIKKLI